MFTICDAFDDYLQNSYYFDWHHASIKETAANFPVPNDDVETVRKTYEFVRDQVKHS